MGDDDKHRFEWEYGAARENPWTLAVPARIPCQYCVYYHIKAAQAAVANQEEIREAVHQASLTRHWSTILYGNHYGLETYKAEIDAVFKGN